MDTVLVLLGVGLFAISMGVFGFVADVVMAKSKIVDRILDKFENK